MNTSTKFIKDYPTATDFFNEWATNGKDEGMEKGHTPSVSFMFKKLTRYLASPFSVLDCGCGNGWVVRKFSQSPFCIKAVGIDGAKNMIEKATIIDSHNDYIHDDILHWVPDQPFNIVHSMEVLYYVENPAHLIQKIHDDWVATDGCFIFGIDHYAENTTSVNWPKECGVNMQTQPMQFWINAMKNAGFKHVQHWQTGKKDQWEGTLVVKGEKKES